MEDRAAKEYVFVISDLHLGEGVRYPDGQENLFEDFSHDEVFRDFIDWILNSVAALPAQPIIRLKFLGDTFDPLAVRAPDGDFKTLPFKERDLFKLRKIFEGHPVFFAALKKFLKYENAYLDFFIGNHDFFLEWNPIKIEICQRISASQPDKVRFLREELCQGIYFTHGNYEPHTRFDDPVIIEVTDWPKLLKKKNLKKLIKKGTVPDKEILNVPYDHYLISDVQNPIKRYNRLIGRLQNYGFIWLDAFLGLFRKTWYRTSRFWGPYTVFLYIKAVFVHVLVSWWPVRHKAGFVKLMKVLGWTFSGVAKGSNPSEVAQQKLNDPNIEIVVMGHDHEFVQEAKLSKTYINLGTWITKYEVGPPGIKCHWKYFRGIEKIIKTVIYCFARLIKQDFQVKPVIHFPVLVARFDNGEKIIRTIRTTKFDPEKKTMEGLEGMF